MLSSALSWQIFGFRNPGGDPQPRGREWYCLPLPGILSANTVKGAAGNDLISFANPTTAFTLQAINVDDPYTAPSAGSAGTLKAIDSGAYESAGSIAETIFTAQTSNSAGATTEVSAQVQALQMTGLTTVRKNSLFAAGAGNDSVFFGDQVTTFNDVSVRGGKGNDVLGSFNSGGATTGILSHLSGGEIKGGNGNDTVYINLSGESATDFKIVGNAGSDTVMFSAASAEANSGFIAGGAGNDSLLLQLLARKPLLMVVRAMTPLMSTSPLLLTTV